MAIISGRISLQKINELDLNYCMIAIFQEMLPVSLVKVEVKEEEEDGMDLNEGIRRECSPPTMSAVGPPQDHPLPLLHPRLPTPPQERHLGLPGVEGVGT